MSGPLLARWFQRGRSARVGLATTCLLAWALLPQACRTFGQADEDPEADAGVTETGVPDEASSEDAGPDAEAGSLADGGLCTSARGGAFGERITLNSNTKQGAFPFALTSDEKYLYWLEQPATAIADAYNGHAPVRVMQIEKRASGPARVLAEPGQTGLGIALDGDYVYFSVFVPGVLGATPSYGELRRVKRCDSGSCEAPSLVVQLAVTAPVNELVRVKASTFLARTGDKQVLRIIVGQSGGGTAEVLTNSFASQAMAFNDKEAFLAAQKEGSADILRVSVSGPETQTRTVGMGNFRNIATDCRQLWAMRGATVERIPFDLNGSDSPRAWPVEDNDNTNVFDMGADEDWIYFALPDNGGVYAMPTDTSIRELKTLFVGNVHALHVDDDGVYWGDHGKDTLGNPTSTTGQIFMTPKRRP